MPKIKAKSHRRDTPRISYNSPETIDQIEKACHDVRQRKILNLAEASRQYGIPYGTLRNRFYLLSKPSQQAHNNEKLLRTEQERALLDWMHFLGMIGRPISKSLIRPKLQQLCSKLPGQSWVWRFVQRHKDETRLRKASGLDPKRAAAFNYTTVNKYFEEL